MKIEDKTASILALLIVLSLVYLSNSGKLKAIRDVLSSPAPEPPTASNTASPPAPGEENIVKEQIDRIFRGRIGNLGHGTSGGGQ